MAARNKWRAENKDHDDARNNAYNKVNARRIRGFKLTQYWPGSTPEQALDKFEALNSAQKGLCAICDHPESRLDSQGNRRDLHVDHNHTTGVVRGLLCNSCNRGLGLLNDTIEGLTRAIDYLKKAA